MHTTCLLCTNPAFTQVRTCSCGSWCGLMTAQWRSQIESCYSALNATSQPHSFSLSFLISFSPFVPSYSQRWIIQLLLYLNINTGIDALLVCSGTSPCAVQCIKMRGWWGFVGWLNGKRVVTQSISPSALISMSTVKLPPMSRLGEERRGSGAEPLKEVFFFCAIKLTFTPVNSEDSVY